ncbi:hypothetical protein, partial [Enterococcus faecalis]|uniref:hypothetical protein n=1 Tax=Enterococcus faecalis TaxID=1351 RepID=UPI003D6BB5FB
REKIEHEGLILKKYTIDKSTQVVHDLYQVHPHDDRKHQLAKNQYLEEGHVRHNQRHSEKQRQFKSSHQNINLSTKYQK